MFNNLFPMSDNPMNWKKRIANMFYNFQREIR